MKEDYKTILKVPDLEDDVNIFIIEVEKVINVYRYICLQCIIYTFSLLRWLEVTQTRRINFAWKDTNSEFNSCMYKISKIYGDL